MIVSGSLLPYAFLFLGHTYAHKHTHTLTHKAKLCYSSDDGVVVVAAVAACGKKKITGIFKQTVLFNFVAD